MARMNIDILGISELKWTGTGKFNSHDHYIYYCGQKSLRRNGVAFTVNKRVRTAALGFNLKNDRMISVFCKGKPFNIIVIQVYAPTTNAKEAEVKQFYEDLLDLLELTLKKYICSFHHRGLECKSKKSSHTWSNMKIWPWSTKWSRAKANRVLPRERTGHSKHLLPTTQETTLHRDITRWSIAKSDWLYFLQPKQEKLYVVSRNKTRSWVWLRSWAPYWKTQTSIGKSRENH